MRWESGSTPSLQVTADYDVPLSLHFVALVGTTRFEWTASAFAAAHTTEPVMLSLPVEVMSHPDIVGYPVQIYGTLGTDYQRVGIPRLHGCVRETGGQRAFEVTAPTSSIPYHPAFFVPPDPTRDRDLPEHDNTDDTGLYGRAK